MFTKHVNKLSVNSNPSLPKTRKFHVKSNSPHKNGEEVCGHISHEVAYEIELSPHFLWDFWLPSEAVRLMLMRKITGSNQTEVSNDSVFSTQLEKECIIRYVYSLGGVSSQ